MAENFCSNCGKPLLQNDKFCSACGESTVRTETPAPTAPTPPYYDPRPERKDPFTAALGSLIIVGVGQFYVGKWWRGLGFMAAAIFFFWLTIPTGLGVVAIWILAPIDAYDQAKKHNIKYGYSEEAIRGAEQVEMWTYLANHSITFNFIFLFIAFIGLIILGWMLITQVYIWVFIPIILIVLGIGPLYLTVTKFR